MKFKLDASEFKFRALEFFTTTHLVKHISHARISTPQTIENTSPFVHKKRLATLSQRDLIQKRCVQKHCLYAPFLMLSGKKPALVVVRNILFGVSLHPFAGIHKSFHPRSNLVVLA